MKNFKLLTAMVVAVFAFTAVSAQKIKVQSGDPGKVAGEKVFNVEYDYEGQAVGKFKTQDEYIAEKVPAYNEKEPGRGDTWKESWYNDQKEKFPAKFEELMNDRLAKSGRSIGQNNSDAKYTMVLKTTFTEPGFNIGITRRPAMINVVLTIVETANRDNVIAVISSDGNPGQDFGGYDFDTGYRISEAYAKCGKELANFLLKKYWK